MAAITVSRQLGSWGRVVAQEAAYSLGFRLVWRDLINQAAARAGAPEAALAAIDEFGLFGLCPSPQVCKAYRNAVRDVMEELAAEGNVILVGRAGQSVLRYWPDVMHVRVVAPQMLRVERIVQEQGIAPECALAQVQASDSNRRKYLKRFYGVDWDDPHLYDLILNTARLTISQAAGVLCAAFREFRDPSRQQEKSNVDLARPITA